MPLIYRGGGLGGTRGRRSRRLRQLLRKNPWARLEFALLTGKAMSDVNSSYEGRASGQVESDQHRRKGIRGRNLTQRHEGTEGGKSRMIKEENSYHSAIHDFAFSSSRHPCACCQEWAH